HILQLLVMVPHLRQGSAAFQPWGARRLTSLTPALSSPILTMVRRTVPAILLAAGLSAAACDQPTSVLVNVLTVEGATAPAALSVSVFDPGRARVARRELGPGLSLPGTIVLGDLPDLVQPIRIALASAGPMALGFAVVITRPHAQVETTLVLSQQISDQ